MPEMRIEFIGDDRTAAAVGAVQTRLRAIAAEQTQLVNQYGAYAGARSRIMGVLNQEAAALRTILDLNTNIATAAERSGSAVTRATERITAGSTAATREIKHVVAAFDELASNRRGQFIATLGAALRDAGIGAQGLYAGMAAIASVAAVASVIRTADQMANLNEQLKAGAQVTGMSVREYASLQGALVLTGDKAESADSALRHFASNVEKAMANVASSQAKAFHAIGISQNDLIRNGQNTYNMIQRVSDATNRFADSSTKAAVLTELFGRGDEAIAHFLSNFRQLTDESNKWADAVDKNNAKFVEMAERIHKLSLNWGTLKEEASQPLDFVVNIAIHGLELLNSIPQKFAEFGKYMFDLARPLRQLLGTETAFEGAPALPSTTLDDLNVTAKDTRPHVAPFSTPKGSNAEAHRDFSAFAEEEKNKLRDVNLTLEQQQAILAEWRQGAEDAFKRGALSAAQLRSELAKINAEAIQLEHRNFARSFEQVKSDLSDANRELREFETNMETMVKRKQLSPRQAIGFDIQQQAIMQQAGEAQIQSLYGQPGADIAKINQAWKTFESEQNAAAASLQEKYAAVDASLAKAFEKEMTGVFDKIGSGLEHFITEGLTRSTTMAKAAQQLFHTTVGGLVGGAGDILSRVGGSLLGGKEGQGIGAVLGDKLVNFITGQVTQTVSIVSAIETSTAAIVSAIGLAGANPEVAGFKFARGGIVPSAAGGMVVGGMAGGHGVPAIVHPQEMVLPANISNHILASMNAGGNSTSSMNLTYAPTMTGGRPFESRTDGENFFRKHGNEMMQMARSLNRSRWRG